MARTLKKKQRSRWRFSVEIVTNTRTYTNTVEIETTETDPLDETEKSNLFEGAGVPDDMGPEHLLSMTFKIERL